MKIILLIIIGIIPFSLWSQSKSADFFEQGLKANEKLLEFLSKHPCEIGLDKTCERPFSGSGLIQLKNVLKNLEEWRKIAFDGIVPVSKLEVDMPFELQMGSSFSVTQKKRFNTSTLKFEAYLKIELNHLDPQSAAFMHRSREGLTTTLLVYDSFFRLTDILARAKKLRSILQYDLKEEGPVLEKTYALVMNETLWNSTTHAMKFLEAERKVRGPVVLSDDDKLFDQYLSKSFVGQRMLLDDMDFRVKRAIFTSAQLGQSHFFESINLLVGALSKLFGNTAGLVQTRSGMLKTLAQNPERMKALKAQLRPLDILLEKTPFRLTDSFIPGYFGHAALWLGNYEELSQLSIIHNEKIIPFLTHPDVAPHAERIKKGESVLEALRIPGVTLNTLEHFMDIDDLGALAAPEMNDEVRVQHLLRAFQQVGKPYDFNFNVETEREIVCSELIYTIYTQHTWPTSISFGRFTISPDQVAWKAVDACFEPIFLFLSGKQVKSSIKSELKRVLELPGGIEYTPTGECLKF
jgi:hypothetical protein